MSRRKLKSSTLSIFHWFCKNIAIVLGLNPQTRRSRRIGTKRCSRRSMNKSIKPRLRQKDQRSFNNNRCLDNLEYDDQRRIICILAENQEISESIQRLLEKHAAVLKHSRIVDLQELISFIQSSTHQDVSTMTNRTFCADIVSQSENTRRLKALEFIRLFLENNEEDFCQYLINEEHLCQRKTHAIYQAIKQFLKVIYQSKYVQDQRLH